MKTSISILSICLFLILGINPRIVLAATPTIQASNIIVSNITATSATVSWTNGNGEKRVVFAENPSGTAAAPYDNTTYTASSDWSVKGTQIGTSNYYCVYNGTGNSVTLTNLTPDARFTIRISEYNGSAGSEQYLTTIVTGNPVVFYTLAAPPTIQTSNIVVTNITATSATVSWTNGNGAKRVVFAENPSGTAAAPYNNTTYTASSDWSVKGTRIGTSNYYCVYNGTGNSVTLTNLTPDARFTIRISEYNGSAGSEQYLTTIVTGNPVVFYTLATPPTVQTSNIIVSNITATSATVSWTNGNGAKRVAFAENPSGTAAAPYNNTTYTASSDWSVKGTRIGTSNYYCVYNGTGNSVTLTNLTPGARFTIRMSEYNGSASSEQYLTTIVTGNPVVFYTSTALKSAKEASNDLASVRVYPNLTSGIFAVESTKESEEPMNISIIGLNGDVVYKTSTLQNNFEVDLTSAPSGVYIVNVDVKGVSNACKVIKE